MPSYYCDGQIGKWVKQCSCCKEITVGATSLTESISIFSEMFSDAGPSSGMADGFQSRCWICNASKRRQLGITRPIIEAMMKAQNSECSICSRKLSISRFASPHYKANVDHDEVTGKVRQLLCGDCNRGIGLFMHDADILHRAANYCKHHTAQIIQIKDRSNG